MKSNTETPPKTCNEFRKIYKYALIGSVLWTLFLSGLFVSAIVDNREAIYEIGRTMAQASFEKDLIFRKWAAKHGGVYVPETAATPANPYLAHIPERDITTPSGKRLTLINPAYVTRQIFELTRDQASAPQGHITSLNPIRPENAPDAWEAKALKALELGAKEVVEPVSINGQPYLRFMRQLITEKPCLRCHAAQGYKEGDGRGGISETISLAQIQTSINSRVLHDSFIYFFIWIIGLGFIWLGIKKILQTMKILRNERNRLYESDERYRALFTRAGDGIFILSTEGKILDVNESMARMHGYTVQEMLEMELKDLDTPKTSSLAPERMRRLLAGENLIFEVEHYHNDGHIFSLEVSASLIHSGEEYYVQCFHRDITERKQAEQERRQLEDQFHHAQKLESLGVLAGGIAHDFNNILTVIIGYCYMAREDFSSEEEYKAAFQKIEMAGNRAADLCRQMLTYAGRTESVQTRLNLWLLVDEVVKMLKAAIKKNVTIELDLKRDVPLINGDTGQVQQIVMNLIINAAEAIGDVKGTIRVVLSNAMFEKDHNEKDAFGMLINDGKYACLEVSDTGIGMDETTQKRIFEPFYTTKFTGRGLGMSAIRGIVKSHEGALQLTSTPGIGTTFKVYFPLPEAIDYAGTDLIESYPIEGASGTILLVDDERTLRTMAAAILESMGFYALTAQDGLEALEIFSERGSEIDMILLDLIMPQMGGIETYHELRKIAATIPIIICSGYSVEEVSDIIVNDEFAGFVQKPYKPEQLRIVIVKMMGQKSASEAI